MTIGELRKALAAVPADHDHRDFIVWIPGYYVDVVNTLSVREDKEGWVVVEGVLRDGVAPSGH